MNRNLKSTALIAVGLIAGMAASSLPSHARTAAKLSRVLGGISKVDTTTTTITLAGYGTPDQTIAYNKHTKYMLDITATVSDIKVGDTLRSISLAPPADPKSITPDYLNIVPPVDVNGPPFIGPATFVQGVVSTVNPLTITTPDKQTVTIVIGDKTLLSKSTDATSADVQVGKFGSAIVKGEGAGRVLTELHIITPPSN